MGRMISGRYEELERLGQGGQGVVYKVRHLKHKTVLALKALPSYLLANPTVVGRLEQEALVLTRLRHRNIVQVVGTGRDEALELFYIVMEYIEGKTLKEYIQEKDALPLPEVLEITRQVGNALAYAHGQMPPVIHRDIKPSNIIIEDFSGRVVLLDFGIAKELDDTNDAPTRTGHMVGTWRYSSPEQLRHESLTGSADIYSLGMVMYEMYTGTPFFTGRDEPSALGRIIHEPQDYTLTFPPATSAAFVALVQKAVAKSREKRYARMEDFLRDVEVCWAQLDATRVNGLSKSMAQRLSDLLAETESERTSAPRADKDHSQSSGGTEDRDLETIDAEIRKLQEERQKRFLLSLQARVKEAREHAEEAGALQWAEAQFAQGTGQEEQASTLLQASDFTAAQASFEAALQSFAQATEEVERAKLRSRAEQARRDVELAKRDADRQNAATYAPDAYARAQQLVIEAESQLRQEAYEEARKRYAEACSSFEDARDLAYRETRRAEADAARTEVATARDAAVSHGAETYAAALVEEAQRNEQLATAAWEQEDFAQARVLYLAASQKYAQAQRRAQAEQERVRQAARTASTVTLPAETDAQGQATAGVANAPVTQTDMPVTPTQGGAAQLRDVSTLSQANEAELKEQPEDATVIRLPLRAPERPVVDVVPPTSNPVEGQTDEQITGSSPPASSRMLQTAMVAGIALLAVVAGLYLAYLGSLGDSPEQQMTKKSPPSGQTTRSPTPPPPVQRTPDSQGTDSSPASPQQQSPPTPVQAQPPVQAPAPQQQTGAPVSPQTSPPAPSPVPSPPPVATTPARIVTLTPAGDTNVVLAEGSRAVFAVTVNPAGAKTLRYDWFVDENKLTTTTESRWTYAPGSTEGSPNTKTVTVVLRDDTQELDRKSWTNVLVKDQPRVPKIGNPSPELGKPIEAAFGEEVPFSIEVDDPDQVAGQPTWLLDKKKIGQGVSQRVRIPAEGAMHTVTVMLTDGAGEKPAAEWTVVIPTALQPRIVDTRPKGDVLTTQVGTAIEFTANADLPVRLPGAAKPDVEWRVDGTVRQTRAGQPFRFVAEQDGTYEIAAVAMSREGIRGGEKKWTVRVQPPPLSGARLEWTKEEVRDWLERYRRALEQKDGKMLEQLGLDRSEIRDRIDDVKGHEDLVVKIEIQDQDIQLDGQPARRAQIRFTRRDVRDGIQTAPGEVRYTLEKRGNGRIVVSR